MATLDDVYRKFGEVSEAAQLLETELGNSLLNLRARERGLYGVPNPQAARELLEHIDRLTLGSLLRQVSGLDGRLEEATDLLIRALAERNRLSHSYFRQHNFRRNSAEGCAIMLRDLDAIHGVLLDAYKFLLRVSGVDLDPTTLQNLPTRHIPLE